ncbi:hypothetical protein ASC80_14890 [Afipia sp. Root123D2]|uniref:hypothetical protein n=1 Tax=Afipia sp. Root123D2 TaxID=1736436 RepID=UPI0007018FE1|nr:hypothetical protein [Afipia sp. Root123D2]KQW21369.1 hypothetical protein ASC80_14890 [Afipia sp. Root123D2]
MSEFSEPKPFDLKSKGEEELIALFHNRGRHGLVQGQIEVLREMWLRGYRIRKYCGVLSWTPDRANEVIAPFAAVSRRCRDSKRTDFSTAGGGVYKAKSEPDARWVDTYTAVKVPGLNAHFSCHIREPGDDAEFILNIKSHDVREVFTYDQNAVALERWTAVVTEACGKLE